MKSDTAYGILADSATSILINLMPESFWLSTQQQKLTKP
jgi:hypothetical protein